MTRPKRGKNGRCLLFTLGTTGTQLPNDTPQNATHRQAQAARMHYFSSRLYAAEDMQARPKPRSTNHTWTCMPPYSAAGLDRGQPSHGHQAWVCRYKSAPRSMRHVRSIEWSPASAGLRPRVAATSACCCAATKHQTHQGHGHDNGAQDSGREQRAAALQPARHAIDPAGAARSRLTR